MQQLNDSDEKNAFSIDDLLITISTTFIIGFIALSSTAAPFSLPVRVSYAVSLAAFAATLLMSIWNKYRQLRRYSIFRRLEAKFTDDMRHDLEALQDVCMESVQAQVGEYFLKNSEMLKNNSLKFFEGLQHNLSSSDIKSSTPKHLERLIDIMSSNLAMKYAEVRKNAFEHKFDEPNAKLKNSFEIIAKNTRHYFFIAGVVTFLVAVFVSLI